MFPLKAFYWGQGGARENFALQIQNIVEAGYRNLGEIPIIIGECGIPMDMKSVFLHSGTLFILIRTSLFSKRGAFLTDDFYWQMRMMDAMMTGLERSLVGFT